MVYGVISKELNYVVTSGTPHLVNLNECEPLVGDGEDPHLGDDHVHAPLARQGQGTVLQDLVGSTLKYQIVNLMSTIYKYNTYKIKEIRCKYDFNALLLGFEIND